MMSRVQPVSTLVAPFRDNKRQELLDSAAQHFAMHRYDMEALRDIATTLGMKAASIYYYFSYKEDLLVALHGAGVRRISSSVKKSLQRRQDSWQRPEAVMIAHLEALFDVGYYVWVVIRTPPQRATPASPHLIKLQYDNKRIFVYLVAAIPLFSLLAKRHIRSMILGAMNSAIAWYRAACDAPEQIAKAFVQVLH